MQLSQITDATDLRNTSVYIKYCMSIPNPGKGIA